MKFLYSLLLLVSFNIYSQDNFEGIIEYDVEIKFLEGFKKLGVSEKDYLKALKEKSAFIDRLYFIYKNGNYITAPKLKSKYKQLYLYKANKLYFFEDDIVVEKDASVDLESKKGKEPTVELLPEETMIEGVSCHGVKVTWKQGSYYYYYSSGFLNVDPALFKFHTYDMWNKYLEIAKCLPLRIVKEVNNFSVTVLTAKKIEKKNIEDSAFDLPKMKEDLESSKYKQSHEKVYIIQ